MYDIDTKLKEIDSLICRNIDSIDFLSRALVSQNLLGHSRTLVEHVALKAYSLEHNTSDYYKSIKAALEYIKHANKYLFLRKFHIFLQESKSHYIPDDDGAERLTIKYYEYYVLLRNFVFKEYGLNLLYNLEKFPISMDAAVVGYYRQVIECLKERRPILNLKNSNRVYVMKSKPIDLDGTICYENTLIQAIDTTSKFDRFIAFSSFMIPDHYAIQASIFRDEIYIDTKKMPVNILSDFQVSIRPCELNNYAKILGYKVKMDSTLSEYQGLMNYFTKTGSSLADIIKMNDDDYKIVKETILNNARTVKFFDSVDDARELVHLGKSGSNIILYLAKILRNKVLKDQFRDEQNSKLSELCLQYGSIPFDQMPFATSLISHNPEITDLIESIDSKGREHEQMARYIQVNTTNGNLYTKLDEVSQWSNVPALIRRYNGTLYQPKHHTREICCFGRQNLYIKEFYEDTKRIIKTLIEHSKDGITGYADSLNYWLEENPEIVKCEEKKDILSRMFEKTQVSLVYGAAGTGKTYLLNHVAQFFDNREKLFLANTNPAVDNLCRKIKAQKCEFSTIAKFLLKSNRQIESDILIMDECSMISNSDMRKVLEKAKYKLLVLVGDTYQIESISFGNWFSLARYFLPRYAWNELNTPYRTKSDELLSLWNKVRNLEDDVTEHLVHNKYSSILNDLIFERKSNDEIILCLNYNGLYGINNINHFLQNNNSSEEIRWGIWTYKVGDPILFNESHRFVPVIYNNLKGTIVNIEVEQERIWFSIQLEIVLNSMDIGNTNLELLPRKESGGSVIRFYVDRNENIDDDDDNEIATVIPFQIAYAISIHKAQGLEYDSVKVVITEDIDQMITHNIFYTAITRARKELKIFWSPESQQCVISRFKKTDSKEGVTIFSAHSELKIVNKYI